MTTTSTQAMPPSWTNNTDPNVDFDTRAAYQVTLPFNAFWANLHPNSNIAISYSDAAGAPGSRATRPKAARARAELVEQEPRVRRGQAVGRRQPHSGQSVPGPRLRGLGDL